MKKEAYLKKRQELMAKAQAELDAGNIEESNSLVAQVKKLDEDFEEAARMQANLNALAKAGAIGTVPEPFAQQNNGNLENLQVVNNKQKEAECYRQAFAKKLLNMELSKGEQEVFNAVNRNINMAANTAKVNSVVVPDTMSQEIWQEAAELHPIIKDVSFTTTRGTVDYIKETQASDDAEWVTETKEAKDSSLNLSKITLSGCELIKCIPVTKKLQSMSIDSFLAYITSQLAERMGASLASGIVSGAGPSSTTTKASEPTGIITELLKDTEGSADAKVYHRVVQYDSSVTYKDVTGAFGLLKSAYMPGAKIYAQNSDIWGILANIVDGQKRPIFIPDVTGQIIGRLFGRSVVEEDAIPAANLLLGNVNKGYVGNFNEDMVIEQEYHAKQHYTDYVAYSIVDGAVKSNNAFALICPTIS